MNFDYVADIDEKGLLDILHWILTLSAGISPTAPAMNNDPALELVDSIVRRM